jgi:hypothetical protein
VHTPTPPAAHRPTVYLHPDGDDQTSGDSPAQPWRSLARGAVFSGSLTRPIARWPNPDEADTGCLYYQSSEGRTSITDDRLASSPDFSGAETVLLFAAPSSQFRLPFEEWRSLTSSDDSPQLCPHRYPRFRVIAVTVPERVANENFNQQISS